MKHRVFIAINLPEKIKKTLMDYQERWRDLPVRWVRANSLHLTLAFLGDIGDQGLGLVCQGLKDIVKKYSPFFINLTQIDYDLKEEKMPRLVWIIGEKSENLSLLKKDLDDFLNKTVGFLPESRDFLPHITLGRINKWQWNKIEPDERPEIKEDFFYDFEVNSIEVMESHLKRTGAEYITLQSELLKNYE
ncbi:MAG: RNA 2',3'-cyclic phosphodiesterase [Candidatus Nealsonbacteria bacterium]|nr:RNA 2',3'-cyclic phosphodiesterase [Candidatus Nealsonbacteria bacterium]